MTVAVASLVFVACGNAFDQVGAVNHTGEVLRMEIDPLDGRSYQLGTINPGQSTFLVSGSALGQSRAVTRDGCTFGDVVALYPAGREVARRPPLLCVGDRLVIEAAKPTGVAG